MKKVLILGVNGFIGHHLSQRIIETTDWEVYGMDMQSERVADLINHPRFHFFECDITINKEWIEYHVRKCDTVLPLVAIATPATYVKEPLRVFELDFEANLPIIRHAVKYKKRVIFPSTSEVYGMSTDGEFDPEKKFSANISRSVPPEDDFDVKKALKPYSRTSPNKPKPE